MRFLKSIKNDFHRFSRTTPNQAPGKNTTSRKKGLGLGKPSESTAGSRLGDDREGGRGGGGVMQPWAKDTLGPGKAVVVAGRWPGRGQQTDWETGNPGSSLHLHGRTQGQMIQAKKQYARICNSLI